MSRFVVHMTSGELQFYEDHTWSVRGGALEIMRGEHCVFVVLIAPQEWKRVLPDPAPEAAMK